MPSKDSLIIFLAFLMAILSFALGVQTILSCGKKEIDYIVVCPDGQSNCTRYETHEFKVHYK